MTDRRPKRCAPTAVIAGGAGALGSAMAHELAQRGYHVAVADIDIERGQTVVRGLQAAGAQVDFYALDVTQPTSWTKLRDTLHEDWPQLDMLVVAAGALDVNDFENTPVERHTEVVSVNLLGTIHGCHAFIPWLKSNPQGSRIVLVASCVAFLTAPWSGSYNASKAGVLALGETLAAEYGPDSIRVTTACPAFFRSGLFDRARVADPALDRLLSKFVQNSPLTAAAVARRICDAAEKGRPYVVMPWRTYAMWWLKRLMPSVCIRKIGRDGHRFRARSAAAIARRQEAEPTQSSGSD